MASIVEPLSTITTNPHLRPFEARRDLYAAADLIELGFADTLDEEGKRYLSQMRATADSYKQYGWLGIPGHLSSYSMAGFVWEEHDRVIGNLNIIPYLSGARRYYLIANVVVHPDYRRLGIGRALTARAIEQARSSGAPAAWLHVRAENSAAIDLYRSLGFVERACRTTWNATGDLPVSAPDGGTVVGPRLRQDWPQQRAWLQASYPRELLWNLPLRISALSPGLMSLLGRIFSAERIDHWAVHKQGKLVGVASHQVDVGSPNILWLAAPVDADEDALGALLAYARRQISGRRLLTLDYPAGRSTAAFQAAGFRARQTLIWMEIKF